MSLLGHFFAGDHVVRVGERTFKVLHNELNRFHRQPIGVIRSQDRDVGFERVRQDVHPGVGGDGFGHGFDELRVDNRNVRRKFIIRKRVLDIAVLLIGNDTLKTSHENAVLSAPEAK